MLLGFCLLFAPSSAIAADASVADRSATTISTMDGMTVALDSKGRAWYWKSGNTSPNLAHGSSSIQLKEVSVGQSYAINAVTDDGHIIHWDTPTSDISQSTENGYSQVRSGLDDRIWALDKTGQLKSFVANNGSVAPNNAYSLPDGLAIKTYEVSYSVITALASDNTVWTAVDTGSNNPTFTQLPIPSGVTIRQVSDNILLDQSGLAYTYGLNDCGAYGDGQKTGPNAHMSDIVPVTMPDGVKFTHANAGGQSTYAAIDQAGRLWTWGCGSLGLLGIGNAADSYSTAILKPGKANLPEGVTASEIAVNAGDTLRGVFTLKDINGNVWTWGKGLLIGDGGLYAADYGTPHRALGFDVDNTNTGGMTVISCAPTTGVAPTGLSVMGFAGIGMLLIGIVLPLVRRRI